MLHLQLAFFERHRFQPEALFFLFILLKIFYMFLAMAVTGAARRVAQVKRAAFRLGGA
ncbi:MAG: hypothetical protein KGJ13_02105 [Patescibacteria group bacterium]|nr:hypothetical protein [Patescibacteria group bacterium]